MLFHFISTLTPTPDQPTTAREAISQPLLVVLIIVGAFIFTRLSHVAATSGSVYRQSLQWSFERFDNRAEKILWSANFWHCVNNHRASDR
jgi:hypothetical protein